MQQVRSAGWLLVTAACGLVIVWGALRLVNDRREHRAASVSLPNSRLTPGATVLFTRNEVCGAARPKNKDVPASMQQLVLREYGLTHAESRLYEIDYLITPALGGADDIHNLWPQSYSSSEWNAKVKDDLEDRLHAMVCQGSMDLTTAQREIAGNWIVAYKKYFGTDHPASGRYER
jgi:hypothetical protein